MFCSRRLLQQWCLAVFLLCSPVPHYGRPIDALSNRMKRSVTHAQLMHDKGRTLQDYKRRMWLQELLDVVHTAETRDLPVRTGVSSGAGVGLGMGGGGAAVSVGMGMGLTTGGSTLHPKPAGGTKNIPISFRLENEEGTNLPQETHPYKDPAVKVGGKKKNKKGRSGEETGGGKEEEAGTLVGMGASTRAWERLPPGVAAIL